MCCQYLPGASKIHFSTMLTLTALFLETELLLQELSYSLFLSLPFHAILRLRLCFVQQHTCQVICSDQCFYGLHKTIICPENVQCLTVTASPALSLCLEHRVIPQLVFGCPALTIQQLAISLEWHCPESAWPVESLIA